MKYVVSTTCRHEVVQVADKLPEVQSAQSRSLISNTFSLEERVLSGASQRQLSTALRPRHLQVHGRLPKGTEHILYPLLKRFENLPSVFTQLTNKYLSLQGNHSGRLSTKTVRSLSETSPHLCHGCVILLGNKVSKNSEAVETDHGGCHEIAGRVKGKLSTECRFLTFSGVSTSVKAQRKLQTQQNQSPLRAYGTMTCFFLPGKCLGK